ncbi:hypothetical protein JCM10908_006809 [Rhodotorula pacifica]|uniref:MYND-type zinc finger protein MUB1 n=1 Tax=Rhodotorula pacifica TaxID=1495444 RepID=UPI00316C192B
MRESNFSFPTHGRACICVSSGIYDRRALDAPTASLPLINSLTHLSYLTATSPRVREILAGDGGLERLIRILQQCAQGGSAADEEEEEGAATRSSANGAALSSDVKGKGKAVARRRPARKSPFKPFAEYSALPTMADVRVFEDLGFLVESSTSSADQPSFALPPSLALPPPNKQRTLLHTYTLAFQCIVNIGVRGSEAIRTRVVEAGALDVVVFVLERYLEDVERRRAEAVAQFERQRQNEIDFAAARLADEAGMEVEVAQEQNENDVAVAAAAATALRDSLAAASYAGSSSSSSRATPQISLPPTAASLPLPLLTRINVVAASNSAFTTSTGLQPPSRVQTPDTILSMDDASVTGDENGSASGADAEGDEVSMPSSSAASTTSTSAAVAAPVPRCVVAALSEAAKQASSVEQDDGGAEGDDDVEMRDATESADRTSATLAAGSAAQQQQQQVSSARRQSRPALPRLRSQPEPLPSYASRASDSSTARSPVSYAQPPSRPAATTHVTHPIAASPAPTKGPLRFRDEDVLLSLQLLAYLSKYPHVRAIFHSSAVANVPRPQAHAHSYSHSSRPSPDSSTSAAACANLPMNIFSLVEAFTFKPASDDAFTPRHSSEVQYWAGVIMRNACRKDDARGGIRQCANMRCVKWEQYAREFAKCRRCRRAKYCSKTCQSEAWTQGHRYWCHKVASRRADSGEVIARSSAAAEGAAANSGASAASSPANASSGAEGLATPRGAEPLPTRRRHHHHHHHHHQHGHSHGHGQNVTGAAASAASQSHASRRRHRSADEDDEDEDEFPPPATLSAVHDAGATPRAHAQRLPGGAPQFDLGDAEIGPTQTGLVPGVDEDHIAREMLRAASGTGIGIGLGDNFDGVVRLQAN